MTRTMGTVVTARNQIPEHDKQLAGELGIAPVLFAAFFSGLFFFLFARIRLLELDAGFYTMAGKLVSEGRQVYLDFFYPQMPLWPYLYAVPFKLFGATWAVARSFTVLLAAANSAMLFLAIRKQSGPRWAWFGTAVFTFGALIFPWLTAVKSYALTSACLLSAFVLLSADTRQKPLSPIKALAAGALIALAVQTRLYVVVVLAPAAIRLDLRRTAWMILGFAAALTPSLIFFCLDRQVFLFNNLGYHEIRSLHTASEELLQKLESLGELLGIIGHPEVPRRYFPFLLWAALVSLFVDGARRRMPQPALFWGFTLFVTSLIPTPVYPQYFCLVAPFFVISFCSFAKEAVENAGRFRNTAYAGIVGAAVLLLVDAPQVWHSFTRTGIGVPGIGNETNAKSWRTETFEKLSEAVDRHARPGQFVYATWSGVLLESHAQPWPGTENRFGLKVADQLSEKQQRRYKVVSRLAMANRCNAGKVELVVTAADRRKTIEQTAAKQFPRFEVVERVEKWGVLRRIPR